MRNNVKKNVGATMQMMMPCAWIGLMMLTAVPALAGDGDILRVTGGDIRGTRCGPQDVVRVYRGIPYAASTAGANRWRPPQPVVAWEGVRDCTQFGPVCPQPPYAKDSPYYHEPKPESEDCLSLNIWSAAKDANERRPVMVWVHGGALRRGSGAVDLYDGTALAQQGVVVVTINYRLGALGFLAHPELTAESQEHASGNYGFLDQIAALKWVRENIDRFGGDPNCVTIFGESAGALSVCVLSASPLAKGLFHRVIAQSGSAFRDFPDLETSESNGRKFADAVGAKSLAELREVPPEILMQHGESLLSPNLDGWCLVENALTTFEKGMQHDVPTIMGSNADEMTTLAPIPSRPKTVKMLDAQILFLLGSPEEVHRLYPADSDADAAKAFLDIAGDATFTLLARTWARLSTRVGGRAYLYQFTYVTPQGTELGLGSFHASEIAFAFKNLDRSKASAAEQQLAETMSSYWVNFARTGDPNAKGLPEWPAYDANAEPTMEFAESARLTNHVRKEKLDLLESLLEKRRPAAKK